MFKDMKLVSINPVYVYGDKPRTQNFRQDANVQITNGYNVSIGLV